MRDGFFKVGAATPEIFVADCERNGDSIIAVMDKAYKEGVRLLVLPELCVTGSACGDLFFQSPLITSAWETLLKIMSASKDCDMLTAVGLPAVSEGKLYNCTALILRGELIALVPKKKAGRHFSAGDKDYVFSCANFPELTIGFEGSGAAAIIMPYADCELAGAKEKRLRYTEVMSENGVCAYICAGAGNGESTTDMVFGGHNIIAEKGHILSNTYFSSDVITADIDLGMLSYQRRKQNISPCEDAEVIEFTLGISDTELTRSFRRLPFVPDGEALPARCEEVLEIQCHGLYKRMKHTEAKKLVIGVSGGLDSALALIASVRTAKMLGLSESDVITVTMPCFGTSDRTKNNAEKLCTLLGTELMHIDITESVERHFEDIGHDKEDRNIVFENSQARERTQVLMDIANARGGIVVGTGDLSELSLGFATYNGDHMSMYGVNSSVPKTLIRAMIGELADNCDNSELAEALRDIAATPVSPELLPSEDGGISQKTEELIGSYELNDFFLYHMMSCGYTPKKLLRAAGIAFPEYSRDELKKWLRLFYGRFFGQQYKRSCLPDGPKVGTVSLSPRGDFMMPSDACAEIWIKEVDRI